jgi:TRAP transporter TAXI family solute receptor
MRRRDALLGLSIAMAGAALSGRALAQAGGGTAMPPFFRIGTGGSAGVYFPLGGLIARAVAESQGGTDCPPPASPPCGVPGLLAVAQNSNGSVSNVEAMQAGAIEAGLVQSDIAYWAYSGTGIFAGKPPATRLRFLARLYPEAVHVVVRRGAGITRIADLIGKRVSLDEPGSGTLAMGRALLTAYGLQETSLRAEYVKPELAAPRLAAGNLDAFFFVGGWPLRSVSELAAEGKIELLPVTGEPAAQLLKRNPFLSRATIPANMYPRLGAVETVTVTAQLLARADLPDAMVEAALQQIWSQRGLALIRAGHPRGADLELKAALEGRAIPLHPGALRYYRSAGLDPGPQP